MVLGRIVEKSTILILASSRVSIFFFLLVKKFEKKRKTRREIKAWFLIVDRSRAQLNMKISAKEAVTRTSHGNSSKSIFCRDVEWI